MPNISIPVQINVTGCAVCVHFGFAPLSCDGDRLRVPHLYCKIGHWTTEHDTEVRDVAIKLLTACNCPDSELVSLRSD